MLRRARHTNILKPTGSSVLAFTPMAEHSSSNFTEKENFKNYRAKAYSYRKIVLGPNP
jgi:hypothetical protein